jgi:hypothetical protein
LNADSVSIARAVKPTSQRGVPLLVQPLTAKLLGKAALLLGTALVLFSVAGASTLNYPAYFAYYYASATGLSIVVGGLLALVN